MFELYTINDKSYGREKLCGFCGFLMNCKSFPYKYFEQWQHFQCRCSKNRKSFPYISLESSKQQNFCLAQLLSFTVYMYTSRSPVHYLFLFSLTQLSICKSNFAGSGLSSHTLTSVSSKHVNEVSVMRPLEKIKISKDPNSMNETPIRCVCKHHKF